MEQNKVEHLRMIQGVISRMASDTQNQKTFALTVTGAVIALGEIGPGSTQILAFLGVGMIVILWQMTARQTHVEHAYRRLYDDVRRDAPVEPFTMDWRQFSKYVSTQFRLSITLPVLLPYLALASILGAFAAIG